jgi:hypothetical protein
MCGEHTTTEGHVTGNATSVGVSVSTGVSVSFGIYGLKAGVSETFQDSLTTTHSTESSVTITLDTASACVGGPVDVFMDTAFGSFVTIPHLVDSCQAPTGCGTLVSGQSLVPGQSVTSCNGNFSLSMEPDGTLIEFYNPDGSQPTSLPTAGGMVAIMQTDGNFVVYDANWSALFASGTSSTVGAYLKVQDDGYIMVYNPSPDNTGGQIPPLWMMAPGG